MKTITYKNMNEFANDMVNYSKRGKDVTAVMFWKEASMLIKELMKIDNTIPGWIEIEEPEFNNYDLEYYISILPFETSAEGGMSIYAEKAYQTGLGMSGKNEGYLFTETDSAYIHGDVNSAILSQIDATRMYELEFEEDSDRGWDMTISLQKGEDITVSSDEKEYTVPFDIEIDVNVTTDSNGKLLHLDQIEKLLLEYINEAIDALFESDPEERIVHRRE